MSSYKHLITQHNFFWRGMHLLARHTPDHINAGWSLLDLYVIRPYNAPLPITRTGHVSHELDADELTAAGGPEAFFTSWLDQAAQTRSWQKIEFRSRQTDLFDFL